MQKRQILKTLNQQSIHLCCILFLTVLVLFYARNWINHSYPLGYSANESMANILPALYFKEYLIENFSIPNWSDYSYWGRPFLEKFPFLSFLLVSLISIVTKVSILTSWKILVIGSLLAGGWIIYFIAFQISANSKASLLAALIFTLIPFHTANTSTLWIWAASYALLPLSFYAYERFNSELNYENTIKFSLLSAILLAFDIQHAIMIFFFLGIYGVGYNVSSVVNTVKPLQKTIKFHFILLIFILLLFSYLWLPYYLIEDTSAFDIALGGRNINYDVSVNPKTTLLYDPAFLKDVFYLSPLFYLFVLLGLFSKNKTKYLWALLFIVSYLMALGKHSPLDLYLLIKHIPFINKIRFPFRHLYITILSGSVLCCLGYQWVENKIDSWNGRYGLFIKYFYFCIIVGLFLFSYFPFGAISFKSTKSVYSKADLDTYKWISEQNGFFRILEFPRDFRYNLSPYFHGKKTVFGSYQEEVSKTSYLLEKHLRSGIINGTGKDNSLVKDLEFSNIKFIVFHNDEMLDYQNLSENGVVFEKEFGPNRVFRNNNFRPYATLYKALPDNVSDAEFPYEYQPLDVKFEKITSQHIEVTFPPRPFSSLIILAETYDKNWLVTSRNNKKEIILINKNFMGVKVSSDETKITFIYEENIIERIANIISLSSFALLTVSLIGYKLMHRYRKK